VKEYLLVIALFLIVGIGGLAIYHIAKRQGIQKHPEVSALEDLMREHGLLARILMIYHECVNRFENGKNIDYAVIEKAAEIIQLFIEGYHEKDEENYLFPLFERNKVMVDLVKTLLDQHEKGRALTAQIKKFAHERGKANAGDSSEFITLLNSYIAMYTAHAAREDTELYPAFHSLISTSDYKKLADLFEDEETAALGKDGFERMVLSVAELEKQLGIENLAHYTPR